MRMAKKKDFSNMMENPAMAFISTPEEQPKEKKAAGKKAPVKKNLRGDLRGAPDGYRLDPRYIEMKTRRVQLVLQPSVYDAGKQEADRQGISFNDYISALVRADRGMK